MRTLVFRVLCAGLLTGFMMQTDAYQGKNLVGKAVSTHFRNGPYTYCSDGLAPWRGSLVVYTLQNSQVTRGDTIYKGDQGFAHYPAFNLAGTKIAFYRFSQAPSATGGCVTVNSGKSYISLINTDGTVLTDLCELPAMPKGFENFPLDWPAGDWVYYVRPHDAQNTIGGNNSSTMIWRVNASTKVNEVVCNLTDNGGGAVQLCNAIRRFTMSVKGDVMAIQYASGGKPGCTADPINNAVNNVYPLPLPNCALNGNVIAGAAGCNIAISPSGKIKGSYFAGNHDCLFLNSIGTWQGPSFTPSVFIKAPLWDGSIQNVLTGLAGSLQKWSGEEIGNGSELIRWSANSDKWVMQKIGMYQTGHAGNNNSGSNQIVCNFIDSVAINISKNPRPPEPTPSDYVFWNNCAGDLWVSDPGNNPNGDRWEDLQGVWHTADGAIAGANIALTPAQVIAVVEKDSVLANKTLQVSNIGLGTLATLSTKITYGAGATNWLSASASGIGNTQQITLQFNQTSLAANIYKATLRIYEPGTGDTAWVPIKLSVQVPRSPENPANAQPGLAYKQYLGKRIPIPNYDTIAVAKSGNCTGFDLTTSGVIKEFGYRFDGYIDIPSEGIYTFTLNADDMANLYIGSDLIYSFGRSDGHSFHNTLIFDKGPIALMPGKHALRVDYAQGYDDIVLVPSWECQKAGIAKQAIPSSKLFQTGGIVSILNRSSQQKRAFSAMALYNIQGKRVGSYTPGMKNGIQRTSARGLLLAVPEKSIDLARKTMIIVR